MSTTSAFIGDDARVRQRAAILAALRAGPLTTIDARETLSVCHPGGRVLELRRLGFDIRTERASVWDAQGRPHRVALYRLVDPEAEAE